MAYIKPAVLVYQELLNAGGVANSTPDLGVVVIGPLYNVVRVDPTNPTSMQSTLTKAISSMSEVTVDAATDYVEVPLYNPYPGQIVRQSSVSPIIANARVLTYSFDYPVGSTEAAFNTSLRSKFVLTTSTPSPAYNLTNQIPVDSPMYKLPDGSGYHIQKGYQVEITYDDPDVTGTGLTTIKGDVIDAYVNPTTGLLDYIKTSVSVPTFTSNTATTARVRIFKTYAYFTLPNLDSQFIFSDINNDNLRIEVTNTDTVKGFKAFGAVTSTSPAYTTQTDDYLVTQGNVSVAYKALRQDKYSTIMTISDETELLGQLGEATDENPLGLGVSIALKNTTKQVFAVSLQEVLNVLQWSVAKELIENYRPGYALVPLTQNESILTEFKNHAIQLSTPEKASWRALICNTVIPSTKDIVAQATDVNTTGTVKAVTTARYLQDTTETFVSKQVTPGDLLVVTASGGATTPVTVGSYVIDEVINETTIAPQGFSSFTGGGTVSYHIIRNLTRRQRAEEVAAKSRVFGSNRVWHVQPDLVGVNVLGSVKFLPGYYLCAAVGGLISGFPVQQGFTNISVAGIEDLQNSNFYFRAEELDLMAQDGTCLFVQETQDGAPYCRHAITTNMTVLEYREILKVKNWDFLSFFFYDKLKGFIGSWNITPDTLSNIRQVINASIDLLKGKKLPKIGAPLLSGEILELRQHPTNKDNIIIRLKIEIVSPNNYTNLYLVI